MNATTATDPIKPKSVDNSRKPSLKHILDARGVRISLYSRFPRFSSTKFIFWYSIWCFLSSGCVTLMVAITYADNGPVPAMVDDTGQVIFVVRGIRLFLYLVCIYASLNRNSGALSLCAWLIFISVAVNAILYIKSLIIVARMTDQEAKQHIHKKYYSATPADKVRAQFNAVTSVWLVCMVCCNLPLVYACSYASWYIRQNPQGAVPDDDTYYLDLT